MSHWFASAQLYTNPYCQSTCRDVCLWFCLYIQIELV